MSNSGDVRKTRKTARIDRKAVNRKMQSAIESEPEGEFDGAVDKRIETTLQTPQEQMILAQEELQSRRVGGTWWVRRKKGG